MDSKSVFEVLNAINVNDHTEKKQGLTYLSWAWAWAEVKKQFPDATYTVYENADGWNYHTDGKTGWVKTGVTINGLEHIEYLPIMDYRNKSISLDAITSFDVNKAIQRSLTKAVARHGLGLYIYAGEDLPESPDDKKTAEYKAKSEEMSQEEVSKIMRASRGIKTDISEATKGFVQQQAAKMSIETMRSILSNTSVNWLIDNGFIISRDSINWGHIELLQENGKLMSKGKAK